MPLGNPIQKQNNTRIVSATATAGQVQFTVTGGYTINAISVYRNGVRLSNSDDFTASDGSTVSLNVAADVGDTLDFHIFDKFTVSNAIVSAASTQAISGNLNVTGSLYTSTFRPSEVITEGNVNMATLNVSGISTFNGVLDVNSTSSFADDVDFFGDTYHAKWDTSQNSLEFADNALATFGTSRDLAIYHSGSHSFIQETGTGSLYIDSNNVVMRNGGGTETTLQTVEDGGIHLYFNNNQRLETTNTGVDISDNLAVAGISTFTGNVSIADKIIHTGDTNTAIRFPGADTITAETSGSERIRIDSSGRFLIGTTSSLTQYGSQSHLQVAGTGYDSSTILLRRDQDNANPPGIVFAKSRSGSLGGNTVVQSGDQVGSLVFAAADGTDLTSVAAEIKVEIDGTPGSNDVPGRILFHTTADGAANPTERMRIDADGDVGIGTDNIGTNHKLAVCGEAGEYAVVQIKSGSLGHGASLELGDSTDDDYGEIMQFSSSAGGTFTGRMRFKAGGTDTMSLAGGRVLIGTPSNTSPIGWNNRLQLAGTDAQAGVSIRRDSADTGGALLVFGKSRGSLNGSTVVQDGDQIGGMYFAGADGTDVNSIAAQISVEVDGSPGSNDMPGRLIFKTTADGAASPTERMRIHQNGAISIANTRNYYGALNVEKNTAGSTAIDIKAAGTNAQAIAFGDHNTISGELRVTNNSILSLGTSSNHPFVFYTNDVANERVRINTSGDILLVTGSVRSDATQCMRLGITNTAAVSDHYWKIGEATMNGSEGFILEFNSGCGYSPGGGIAVHTTCVARTTNNTNMEGYWYSTSISGAAAIKDIRWKYTGANNIFEIWVKGNQYANIAPIVKLYGGTWTAFNTNTGSSSAPASSTAFNNGTHYTQIEGYNTIQYNQQNTTFLQNINVASGKGIAFADSSTSAVLDDYEEGTWTPNLGTVTGGVVNGEYRKIGKTVFVQCYVSLVSHSQSSTMNISGLPFSSLSNKYASFAIGNYRFLNIDSSFNQIMINMAGTTMTLREGGDNQNWQNVSWDQISNDFSMYISGTYMTPS